MQGLKYKNEEARKNLLSFVVYTKIFELIKH